MHIAIIFLSIGPYHAARLRAAAQVCALRQWRVTAIQMVERTSQHPWGTIDNSNDGYAVKTLLAESENDITDESSLNEKAAKRITAGLNDLRPDAVAIPGWGGELERRALAWTRRNAKIAIAMSESKRDDAKRQWWKEKLKAHLYVRKFDAGLVGGNLHRAYLAELDLPLEKIFIGYDAVDNDYFSTSTGFARTNESRIREQDSRLPSRPYFLATNRLIKRKNIKRLVEAYAAYRTQVTDAWDLVVCGSGEEEESIRRLIAESGLNANVHLPGFLKYPEVGAWYGLAHAFVHPALQEQWGLVINEACAAGLPILCSRTAGAGHHLVRENVNGLLFDPESREDITRALVVMHSFDEATRQAMGSASQRIVADFSPQRFGEGLVKAVDAASQQHPLRMMRQA